MAAELSTATRPARLGRAHDDALAEADVALHDGRIHLGVDGSGSPRFTDALALRDGRVLAVGDDQVRRRATTRTVVVDLDGHTVVPGLIDSHLHLVRAGAAFTQEVHWFEVGTLAAALARLDERATAVEPGTWLRVVGGWHPGQFAEGRAPTREELTRRFPDHPVYLQVLYESAVLNDAALQACGITATADDPDRGVFDRDPTTGSPTGVVRGIGAIEHCLARMPPPSADDAVEGTRQLLALLNGHGLAGGIDAGGLHLSPDGYRPLFELWRSGAMTLRTRLYVGPHTPGGEEDELAGWWRHLSPRFGDAWLRRVGLGEILLFGCHDFEGLTDFVVDEGVARRLEQVLRDLAARGWPVHLHAVLDRTADVVLDVWERVAADHPIDVLRWSLAHVDEVSERNLDRIAALGVGVAVQHRMVYRAGASARRWGDAAVRVAPRLRSIVDRGIPLGAGTDATRVASPNPWVSLWWMVTGRTLDDGPRRDADQHLDRVAALHAYTSGSAWFSFEEHERGRLFPGMVADLAVLSDDYFDVADDDIPALRSLLTLVDGRPVHAEGPFAGLG